MTELLIGVDDEDLIRNQPLLQGMANMSRREFLRAFGATTTLLVAGVQLGNKSIFLPPAGGWKQWVDQTVVSSQRTNTLLTAQFVTNEALKILEGELNFKPGRPKLQMRATAAQEAELRALDTHEHQSIITLRRPAFIKI